MGRRRIGEALDVEVLVEEYLRDCMIGGDPPLVKQLAARLGLTPVTLYRRYLEATGVALSYVFRTRHNEHLRLLAAESRCFEHLAEVTGYSCGRSMRRKLKSIGARTART